MVGATSKWQSDGRNTLLVHGKAMDDSDFAGWRAMGRRRRDRTEVRAARDSLCVLLLPSRLTPHHWPTPSGDQDGHCMIVELDLVSQESISGALRPSGAKPAIRRSSSITPDTSRGATSPRQGVARVHSGRDSSIQRGDSRAADRFSSPRKCCPRCIKGPRICFFSNNANSLRGHKRMTGQSLYYPRVMMRTLAQVLTEEYSEHDVHVANVVVDGLIDSPGTRALSIAQKRPDIVMDPVKIADAFYYFHTPDRSCWTHELQLTPGVGPGRATD